MAGCLLYFRLITELLRYDLIDALCGFGGIRSALQATAFRTPSNSQCTAAVCENLDRILPFYWKPVRCLQRSVVTARVLRAYGAAAQVVVGYRLAPLAAHAWVEVDGRILNDSQVFQNRMAVLERF
jgi:hypothetical protein